MTNLQEIKNLRRNKSICVFSEITENIQWCSGNYFNERETTLIK